MASSIAKFVSKKILQEGVNNNFGKADPYHDYVEETDRKGRPTGKKVKTKKRLPTGISPQDAKVLAKVERRAHRLDQAISICGIKIGWSSVVALVPFLGDFFDVFMALMVINTAKRVKLDDKTLRLMYLNVMIDCVIGLVPFLGDIADCLYRCNTKNAALLWKMLDERGKRAEKAAGAAGATDNNNNTIISQQPRLQQQVEEHEMTETQGPPPQYQKATTGANTDDRPRPEQPDRHEKARSGGGGGGWLGRFSSRAQQERDVERADDNPNPNPTQPPRRSESKLQKPRAETRS